METGESSKQIFGLKELYSPGPDAEVEYVGPRLSPPPLLPVSNPPTPQHHRRPRHQWRRPQNVDVR